MIPILPIPPINSLFLLGFSIPEKLILGYNPISEKEKEKELETVVRG